MTKFVLNTVPQGPVWVGVLSRMFEQAAECTTKGGIMMFDSTVFDAFTAALVKFSSEVTDPKAAVIGSYAAAFGQASTIKQTLPGSICLHVCDT